MGFIVFIHVVVCILLVITILMQAGRGGGLAESFASAESMFGTQTNSFMVKVSTTLAIIFFTTSLVLAVNASKGHKSLMNTAKLPAVTAPAVKSDEPTVKVSEPKPMETTKASAVVTNTVK
jgi:preprotein translocase subunit SecG